MMKTWLSGICLTLLQGCGQVTDAGGATEDASPPQPRTSAPSVRPPKSPDAPRKRLGHVWIQSSEDALNIGAHFESAPTAPPELGACEEVFVREDFVPPPSVNAGDIDIAVPTRRSALATRLVHDGSAYDELHVKLGYDHAIRVDGVFSIDARGASVPPFSARVGVAQPPKIIAPKNGQLGPGALEVRWANGDDLVRIILAGEDGRGGFIGFVCSFASSQGAGIIPSEIVDQMRLGRLVGLTIYAERDQTIAVGDNEVLVSHRVMGGDVVLQAR